MDDLKKSLGYQYLQDTKFDRQTIGRKVRLDIAPAPPSKQYGDAEKVKLPTDWDMDRELRQTLQYRRSWRRFGESPLSMKDISMLLWASQGITGRAGNFFLRAAPSAGALYPVETYLSVQNVETIDTGLFHFQPAEFSLDKLSGFWKKPGWFLSGQLFFGKIFPSMVTGVCAISLWMQAISLRTCFWQPKPWSWEPALWQLSMMMS
jgi:hypothetical protein